MVTSIITISWKTFFRFSIKLKKPVEPWDLSTEGFMRPPGLVDGVIPPKLYVEALQGDKTGKVLRAWGSLPLPKLSDEPFSKKVD